VSVAERGDEVIAAAEDLLAELVEEEGVKTSLRARKVFVSHPAAEDELELGGNGAREGDEDEAAPQATIGGGDQG
jgi:hypothetical protein